MQNSYPLISVIIPVFNRKLFIEDAIRSLQGQTDPRWELIIVDDGSIDGTQYIVSSYSRNDSRVRLFERNRGPKGATTCRNIGLGYASADYVFFLDSDDLIAPYCIEQRIKAFEKNPGYDYYVFSMLLFKNRIDDLRLLTNISTDENDFYRFLRSDLVWSVSCPLWRKDSILRLGGFDESFPNCQDHDLHLRALYHRLKYIKLMHYKPDTFYRQHDSAKIYEPNNNKKILVGVEMLIFKTINYFKQDYKGFSETLFKKNLRITIAFAIRRYIKSGLFSEAEQLLIKAFDQELIPEGGKTFLKLYIYLSKVGGGKIKGFERIWNFIFTKYKVKTNWGKFLYEGDLSR